MKRAGVAGQHGGVHDVLGEHGLTEALRPDEQHIVGEREKVECEDPFEGAAVQGGGPVPIPVGHRFEAAEARGGEATFDAAALPVLECPPRTLARRKSKLRSRRWQTRVCGTRASSSVNRQHRGAQLVRRGPPWLRARSGPVGQDRQ